MLPSPSNHVSRFLGFHVLVFIGYCVNHYLGYCVMRSLGYSVGRYPSKPASPKTASYEPSKNSLSPSSCRLLPIAVIMRIA